MDQMSDPNLERQPLCHQAKEVRRGYEMNAPESATPIRRLQRPKSTPHTASTNMLQATPTIAPHGSATHETRVESPVVEQHSPPSRSSFKLREELCDREATEAYNEASVTLKASDTEALTTKAESMTGLRELIIGKHMSHSWILNSTDGS